MSFLVPYAYTILSTHEYIKHQLPFVDQTNKYFAHENYLMCGKRKRAVCKGMSVYFGTERCVVKTFIFH